MRRILPLACFAIIIIGLDLPTREHIHICHDEHRPSLFGFPMVHRTGVPWVNSMSGVRYVSGTLVNVLCMFMVLWCIAKLLERWSRWRDRTLPKWMPWFVLVPGILLLSLDLLAIDWRWQWASDWDMACFEGHGRIGPLFR